MLATQADIEARLQVDFDLNPDPVIADLIASAQAHVEAFCGRPLESAEHTEVHDGNRVSILLDNWPVTDVSAVAVDGTGLVVATDVKFYSWGRLIRVGTDGLADGVPRMWGSLIPQAVEVTYTGGYVSPDHDSELKHLSSVISEMVARAFRSAVDWIERPAGGIQSIALSGSDSVTYATGSGTIPAEVVGSFLALTPADERELAGYRSPAMA